MLTNVVTSQVIRLVTERVIENLSRQAGRAVGSEAAPSDVSVIAALAQLNGRLNTLDSQIDRLDQQLRHYDERIGTVERRVGWRSTVRQTIGVVCGVALGFGAAIAAHVLGWLG